VNAPEFDDAQLTTLIDMLGQIIHVRSKAMSAMDIENVVKLGRRHRSLLESGAPGASQYTVFVLTVAMDTIEALQQTLRTKEANEHLSR
jgi:hypothetical protein